MTAMDITIIPKRTKALVMIAMKVSEKMDESTLRKRFTEIEIINHDVSICYDSGH
jgi:hypothetical protein